LDRVLEEYGPFDVLKMDCEGCEYDAILNSRRIGELRQIQMEYYYGVREAGGGPEECGLQGRGNEAEKSLRTTREGSQYVAGLHIRSEAGARMWALMIFLDAN